MIHACHQNETSKNLISTVHQGTCCLLKPGGILTYCNMTSADELIKTGKYSDIDKMLQETQLPYLVEAGFVKENITIEAFPVSPPPECRYYSCHQAIAPTIVKE